MRRAMAALLLASAVSWAGCTTAQERSTSEEKELRARVESLERRLLHVEHEMTELVRDKYECLSGR